MSSVATREQIRLLTLLRAAERAGLVPLDVLALHTFAYLANVLSPVWEMAPMDGRILKRRGGPFYPVLQHDLDRLVGLGVVVITGLGHEIDDDGRWRLRGAFRLNAELAGAALHAIDSFVDEQAVSSFLSELGLALSSLPEDTFPRAPMEDATYADTLVAAGNVVDFAEWQRRNFSANAARRFLDLMPEGVQATRSELLHLYVRHLRSRLTS